MLAEQDDCQRCERERQHDAYHHDDGEQDARDGHAARQGEAQREQSGIRPSIILTARPSPSPWVRGSRKKALQLPPAASALMCWASAS